MIYFEIIINGVLCGVFIFILKIVYNCSDRLDLFKENYIKINAFLRTVALKSPVQSRSLFIVKKYLQRASNLETISPKIFKRPYINKYLFLELSYQSKYANESLICSFSNYRFIPFELKVKMLETTSISSRVVIGARRRDYSQQGRAILYYSKLPI